MGTAIRMRSVSSSRSWIIFRTIAAACALLLVVNGPSEAARKKSPRKEVSQKRSKSSGGGGYAPPYAALVVDAKTGKVLHADSPDEIRHPASLTKVMTLYILFDELERGTVTLKTPLKVSAEAARQAPSKLGLRPGETIPVEEAIKAIVTKSANDVAVTIAENISGSHSAFAQRMTRQARALGMNSTVYVNASGLPDPRQVTTARDLVLLGRAIQDNHPNYYGYFSTRSFVWRGQNYGNHNRLVGNVKGVDGIKTGYVRASGFNLLTSANDNDRKIVAVVLGGRSSSSRDARMRELVQANLEKASPGKRTAPLIAAAPMGAEPVPAVALMSERASVPTPAPAFAAAPSTTSVPHPMPRPVQSLPEPVMAAVAASQPVAPEPAAAAVPQPVVALAAEPNAAPLAVEAIEAPRNSTMTPEAIARRVQLAIATTTPGDDAMRWVVGPQSKVTASAYAEGTTPGSPPPRPHPVAEVPAPRPQAVAQTPVAPVAAEPVADRTGGRRRGTHCASAQARADSGRAAGSGAGQRLPRSSRPDAGVAGASGCPADGADGLCRTGTPPAAGGRRGRVRACGGAFRLAYPDRRDSRSVTGQNPAVARLRRRDIRKQRSRTLHRTGGEGRRYPLPRPLCGFQRAFRDRGLQGREARKFVVFHSQELRGCVSCPVSNRQYRFRSRTSLA